MSCVYILCTGSISVNLSLPPSSLSHTLTLSLSPSLPLPPSLSLTIAPPTPVLVRSQSIKQCLGMVSWQLTDLSRVIDTLVTHADINQLKKEVPCCLSAHLLFMCLRYADHCHDDQQTTLFIEGVADSLQKLTNVSKI